MIDRLRRECCQISAAYVILTSPVEQASKEKRGEEVKKGGGVPFSPSPPLPLFFATATQATGEFCAQKNEGLLESLVLTWRIQRVVRGGLNGNENNVVVVFTF